MTTLLVDYNNLAMVKCFNKDVDIETEEPNYKMWEFLVFETIIDKIYQFKSIDEVIIAKDASVSWRKKYFPRYKEKRKDQRKKTVDWDTFFLVMKTLFDDLSENTPFKCIEVNNCEADDIIGVLCQLPEKSIILSSDQDYKQCLNKKVKLFSLYKDNYITCDDPNKFILESSLKGQAKDGIFNVITPLDWPTDLRKPGFGDVKVKKWIDTGLEIELKKKIKYKKPTYEGEVLPKQRYKENRVLMDFNYIPESIKENIKQTYNQYKQAEIEKLFTFIEEKQWRKFLDEYGKIENFMLKLY